MLIGSAATGAMWLVSGAHGQRAANVPRIGLVFNNIPVGEMPVSRNDQAFVGRLRELGLDEGRNVLIERRSAEGRFERFPGLMQELVALKVDVIVAIGPGVGAAQAATDRIPIVALIEDVLDTGLVDSLARPGRNLTGFGGNFPGLMGKQLQLLKEIAPTMSRLAVIAAAQPPGRRAAWREQLDAAARSMQLDLRWVAADAPAEFDAAFATIVRERANGLFVATVSVNYPQLHRIAAFAIDQRVPSISEWPEFAQAGGLLSYGTTVSEDFRRAADYVKKILDGAKPGDLPFEQPTKVNLVINMKTAKAIGLKIPQTLLLRADEVIE